MHVSIRPGTALLDSQYPGWHEAIDLDKLDLANVECCVLGQLAEHLDLHGLDDNYTLFAKQELGLDVYQDGEELSRLGFNAWKRSHDYISLTEKWKRAIRRRLGSS